jgi:hypothetical protein
MPGYEGDGFHSRSTHPMQLQNCHNGIIACGVGCLAKRGNFFFEELEKCLIST